MLIMFGVAKAIYTGESVLLPRKGSLNNVMLVDGAFWTVDKMFYSEPKMKGAAKYVYYGIQVYDLASMNLGTGVPSMTSSRLYSLKLVGAPSTILAKFDAVVAPLLSKARRLLAENKVLAAQRDFLLPLLMNGQVQVKPQGGLNYHLLFGQVKLFVVYAGAILLRLHLSDVNLKEKWSLARHLPTAQPLAHSTKRSPSRCCLLE